jgi:hypothetical protein
MRSFFMPMTGEPVIPSGAQGSKKDWSGAFRSGFDAMKLVRQNAEWFSPFLLVPNQLIANMNVSG